MFLSLQDSSLVNENDIFIALRYVFFTCVTNEQLASPIAIKLIVSKVLSVCSLTCSCIEKSAIRVLFLD